MKRLFILFFIQLICTLGAAQSVLDLKVSVEFKDASIPKCLNILDKKTGVNFSYNSRVLNSDKKRITASFENTKLQTVLDFIFSRTSFQYQEIGGQISIIQGRSSDETVVISGYMHDAKSKELIVGAGLFFPELSTGCISNSYGYYAIEIPKGVHPYTVSFVGMNRIIDTISVNEDVRVNFNLEVSNTFLNTIVVQKDSSSLINQPKDLSTTSGTEITKSTIKELPAVMGEVDMIKYVQQLPGVQPSEDGGANFQVRGLGAGSNLILIDEIPVYHPTHMLGVFSIVNVEAIRSATLYKDYVPLKFGGKSSSVLQIHTNEGNLSQTHLSGGFSWAGGRLNLEGPIIKEKVSYHLSSRASFFPKVAFQIVPDDQNNQFSLPSYYDVNGKVNVKLNSNNRIYLTGYFGKDRLKDTTYKFNWGNLAGSFRWNHIINSKTFSNLSLTHSQFEYGFEESSANNNTANTFSQVVVQDRLRYDVTNFYSGSLKFEFGFDLSWLRTSRANEDDLSTDIFLERSAVESGVYFSLEKKFNDKLTLTGGLRIPYSFHFGKQDTVFFLNPDLTPTEVIYENDRIYDHLFSIDPRAILKYKASLKDQLSFTTGIMSQHTHLINHQTGFMTIGIWTTSNQFLKPERTYSASIGWVHQEKMFQLSTTIYSRYTNNVIDYAIPVVLVSQDIESNLLSGRMFTYGVEFQFNFNPNEIYTASLSYTYAKTDQKIAGINNGNSYPALFDRPHYFNFNQFINASKRWKFATNTIFHSGSAITLPTGQFLIGTTAFPVFPTARNAERLKPFARVDLTIIYMLGIKKKKRIWGDLRLSITNILGRNNLSTVYLNPNSIGTSDLNLFNRNYAPLSIVLNFNFKI